MRVVLWAPKIQRPSVESSLKEVTGVRLDCVEDIAGLEARLPEAEVLVLPAFLYSTPVAQAVLERAPTLRWIQLLTVGFDQLVGKKLPERVIITTAGDSLAPTVAEHAISFLLALGRRLPEALANQSGQRWDAGCAVRMASIDAKTVAIVGFGAIGRETAIRLRAFGARVIGVSRTATPHPLLDQAAPASQMDAVLAEADAAVICLPLTDETRGLFDGHRLRRMKKGAMLINVARGAIVDSHALAEALHSAHLGGAGIDVADPEPLPADHALWRARTSS